MAFHFGYIQKTKTIMRSFKITDDTDYQLETLKLLTVKKYRLSLSKGDVVRYALKALAIKMEILMEAKQDESK
jgi:hypothetical protein